MKMESLQQRREELDRKEYQLKESLLKFDKFLKVQYMYVNLENLIIATIPILTLTQNSYLNMKF